MGSTASKPARSAVGAASRRQYPKKPVSPPKPPVAPKEFKESQTPKSPPKLEPTPLQSSSQAPSPPSPGPTYHSKEQPSHVKSNAIDLDGRDPDFAASLRTIGPVNPSPTLSHSSTFNRGPVQTVFPTSSNPALLVYTARQRVAQAAQEEASRMGSPSFEGRQFLDALTIQQALTMRDYQGVPPNEIERVLRLKKGFMDRFGKDRMVSRVV